MIIDAHHHVWRLARGDYAFPSPRDAVLYRDFMPDDLQPLIAEAGVDRTILVQATDTLAETTFLLDITASTPWVAGVVGWWEPRGEATVDDLVALPEARRLVGIRPMLQKYDDVAWMLEPASLAQLAEVAARGWAFDALVDARQIEVICDLCEWLPDLKVVVDHMGKPWRRPDLFERWRGAMQRLARAPNCWVKVSGFPFAFAGTGEHDDLVRLVSMLRRQFRPDRLVWGSDWPVVKREGGYRTALDAVAERFPASEHPALFRSNAEALYGLPQA